MTTEPRTNRRTAVAALAAGAASMALLAPRPALAAMSSAAGIVAGGSVAGSGGAFQFSAFGSKLTLDDSAEPILFCALSWLDPAGAEGAPLEIEFASVASYGPTEVEGERLMTGTVTVNGEVTAPFALWLFDGGGLDDKDAAPDRIRLAVGGAAAVDGTPVALGEKTDFSYDVEATLDTGNIQIIALEP